MNILFFGNCQSGSIKTIINLNKNKYKIYHEICHITKINKNDFTNLIKKANIIITQPINDNYRNCDYLNTNYILKNASVNCKIIIFNSLHFTFYYPDLKYLEDNNNNNNEKIHEPVDYHYDNMIKCYKNNISEEIYIKNYVNNKNLYSKEYLENLANKSIDELKKREIDIKIKYNNKNVHHIFISDYIKNNYKNKLLFFSMNHPTKILLHIICKEIIAITNLENNINYDIEPLANTRCILYKCIENVVNFDISKCSILTCNKKDVNSITKLYYSTYRKIKY